MAEFSKLVITNKGQALIAKMIAGKETLTSPKSALQAHSISFRNLKH